MPSQIGFGKTQREYIVQVVTNTEALSVYTAGAFWASSFEDKNS